VLKDQAGFYLMISTKMTKTERETKQAHSKRLSARRVVTKSLKKLYLL